MEAGFKFLRQLRKLRTKAEAQIAEGKNQGQDTLSLQGVLDEINRSHDWAAGVLSATDE